MMKTIHWFVLFVCATIFAPAMAATTSNVGRPLADKGSFATAPRLNGDQKWRIAYVEGGEYIDYQKILIETVRGLMKLGWVETADIPAQSGEETDGVWKWLVTTAKSDYLEFLPDGHYSAHWDESTRPVMVASLLERLNQKRDIDLLIAMGTQAGQDFANDKQGAPTMVLSASDPLGSGIIKSVEDSGFSHVHATVDPGRYERQVRVFHEMMGFRKLGIAYEDSVNGRSYAAIETVEKVARERGFEIVRCHTRTDIPSTEEAEQSVIGCFSELADKVDAIYVTVQQGVTMQSIPALVEMSNEHHIPTFSQSGAEEVKLGFLVSLSQAGFRYVGEFHAETFAKIFNGARPNDLNQLFEEPPKIAINLKTAEAIGFDPPVVILGAADEIF